MENNNNSDIIKPLKRIQAKIKLLALINKAKSEYDKANYSGCEEACMNILQNEPNNITALRGLGCVKLSQGLKDEAIKYYQKALSFSENKETDYALIGTAYYIHKDFELAIEYFNKAIDLNDNYDFAYEGRNQSMLEHHLQIADLQDKLINQEFNQ